MSRFTRKQRQEIVDGYLSESGANQYVPDEFVSWVKERPEHPAFGWFEWDDKAAAESFRVEQARAFVRDLRISFTMEAVGSRPVKTGMTTMPAMISPQDGRRSGGGYITLSGDDPHAMDAFCDEAARALDAWKRRYEAAVLYRSGKLQPVEKMIALLSTVEGKAA